MTRPGALGPLARSVCAGLLALAGCGGDESAAPAAAAPAAPTGWHVAGGFLRDVEGRAVLLRGANVSSVHKQPPYFDYHELPDYRRLRDDWGMNAVRFLVSWAALEPEEGSWDETYLDGVAERIGWAREAGLLVVVDMHQDVYGVGFAGGNGAPAWTCEASNYEGFVPADPWFFSYLDPRVMACYDHLWTTPELHEHYAEAWRRLAERLAGDEAVVGFDPMNEPHWGSYSMFAFEEDRLQPFYEKVVPAAREAAPGWVAFVEPSASRNVGVPTRLAALPFGNVAYAPHAYDPDAEKGACFDPSRRKAIVDKIAMLADEAKALGAALWIGEYGGFGEGVGPYMDAAYDGMAAVASSGMYWHYGKDGGYGLLTPEGEEKEALLAPLVRPYPERVAGEPIAYDFDEASSTFTFDYRPDPTVTAPTEISLAPRIQPGGYEVDCGGCETEVAEGVLRITKPPAGETATIVIRPPAAP